MKILKAVVLGGLSLILTGIIIMFERNNWPAGSSLSGIALGFSLPAFWKSLQDLTDTTNWKTSQRKLKHFDHGANRERIDNLSREFKEELIDKSIVNWNCIVNQETLNRLITFKRAYEVENNGR